MHFSLSLLLAVSFLFSFPPAPEAKKSDQDAIQGTWELVDSKVGKEGVPPKGGVSAVFKDDKVTFIEGTNQITQVFRLDPSKTPKHFDAIQKFEGKDIVSPGIYELNGDTLRLCLPNTPTARPKSFEVPADSNLGSFTIRRKK